MYGCAGLGVWVCRSGCTGVSAVACTSERRAGARGGGLLHAGTESWCIEGEGPPMCTRRAGVLGGGGL